MKFRVETRNDPEIIEADQVTIASGGALVFFHNDAEGNVTGLVKGYAPQLWLTVEELDTPE